MKKYTYAVDGKEKINSSEIFPIVYSLSWLRIILSISIIFHFFQLH